MSITGPIAASAASNAEITSACVRRAHHATMISSSASRFAIRPANVAKRSSSPTSRRRSTRAATVSADVETPTHFPSAHRYVPRGTVYGSPAPSRGCCAPVTWYSDTSGPMIWNMLSSRLTSTTWPTPERSATIVANAATRPVTSSVSAIGGRSGCPSGTPLIAA